MDNGLYKKLCVNEGHANCYGVCVKRNPGRELDWICSLYSGSNDKFFGREVNTTTEDEYTKEWNFWYLESLDAIVDGRACRNYP